MLNLTITVRRALDGRVLAVAASCSAASSVIVPQSGEDIKASIGRAIVALQAVL